MNTKFKWIMPFLAFALLGMSSIVGHTAVFSIVPKAGTSLPTHVAIGSSVKALYTVTNTTGSSHTGNYVKYLPTNTTQVTVDGTYPDLCGSTFPLASNASCTLELNVDGPVNANDPNPQDHLFVCLGGCTTCCAGTNFPLSVIQDSERTVTSIAITPVSSTIDVTDTQQYTALGTFSNSVPADITSIVTWESSNTSVATIAAGGLATGVAAGSTAITAILDSITSNSATLTVGSPATVSASLSNTTAFSDPSITFADQVTNFYVVFSVTSGTLTGTETYQATLPGGSGMSFTGSSTCDLSAITTTCSIQVASGSTPGNYSIGFATITGGPVPSPTSDNIWIAPYVFTTGTETSDGTFGAGTPVASQSTSVADAICNSASGKPPGSATYKAMVVVSGASSGNRIACTSANCTTGGITENVDWPLRPNTIYTWYFGGVVEYLGTTNNSGIFTPSTIAGMTGIVYGNWTGLNVDWTTDTSNNCSNWTVNSFGPLGDIGWAYEGNAEFWNGTGNIGGGVNYCFSTSSLYCVQQF